MAYFEGLKNYLKTCPEKELLAYTFVELFENREVHRVITDRLESIKANKDE